MTKPLGHREAAGGRGDLEKQAQFHAGPLMPAKFMTPSFGGLLH
jgi:hypothetical protein